MMQEQKDNPPNQFVTPEWVRIVGIILAYGLTIVGIIFVIPWLFSLSEFWTIGFLLFVIVIPLFPAMQTILLGKRPANLLVFLRIYVAEFASLFLQLGFLLLTTPIIAIVVAGRLVIVLLVTAVMSWLIVGLQQLGMNIGSKMPRADIVILLWVTIGLVVATGLFYLSTRLIRKHEDGYFGLWAKQFVKIREFFHYDTR